MNTLDDGLIPKKPTDSKGAIGIGNTFIVLGSLIAIFAFGGIIADCFTTITNIKGNAAFSRNFRVVYYLSLLFLSAIIGVYLIMLGRRFDKLHKDHDPKHFPKILRLNTQLFFIVLIWLLMVVCLILGYVTIWDYRYGISDYN